MIMSLFVPVPEFSQEGETLSLTEIAKNKQLTSLTITYLSKRKRISVGGVKGVFGGFFGIKKTLQEKKELTINTIGGILYYNAGIDVAEIHFSEKDEFEKLSENDYDETTLVKSFMKKGALQYRIQFHIERLKKIAWK